MPELSPFFLAQINIARARFPLDQPGMADFVARLDDINALAEDAPGFVWRLKDDSGNATSIKAFDDPRIIVNLTVWVSVDALYEFVYISGHTEVMRRRQEWFEKPHAPHMALWWTPSDVRPCVLDGQTRLLHLHQYGPSASAFLFVQRFPAPAPRM
jgi:hypothetical protein